LDIVAMLLRKRQRVQDMASDLPVWTYLNPDSSPKAGLELIGTVLHTVCTDGEDWFHEKRRLPLQVWGCQVGLPRMLIYDWEIYASSFCGLVFVYGLILANVSVGIALMFAFLFRPK
jgi:hypothetical protein